MKEKGLLLALYSVDPNVVTRFTADFYPLVGNQFSPSQLLEFTPRGSVDLGKLNCSYANPHQQVGIPHLDYSGLLKGTLGLNFTVVMTGGPAQSVLSDIQNGVDKSTAQRRHRLITEPHLTVVLERENANTMNFLRGHSVLRLSPDNSQTPMLIIRRLGSILSAREPSIRLGNRQRTFHHL